LKNTEPGVLYLQKPRSGQKRKTLKKKTETLTTWCWGMWGKTNCTHLRKRNPIHWGKNTNEKKKKTVVLLE